MAESAGGGVFARGLGGVPTGLGIKAASEWMASASESSDGAFARGLGGVPDGRGSLVALWHMTTVSKHGGGVFARGLDGTPVDPALDPAPKPKLDADLPTPLECKYCSSSLST
jgi:hypothetical protein